MTYSHTLPLLCALASACSGSSSASDMPDATTIDQWPNEIVLTYARADVDEAGLHFATGALGDPEEADIALSQARYLALGGSGPDRVCAKGFFETIEEVPSDFQECDSDWSQGILLSLANEHAEEESSVIGKSGLFWDREGTTLYRVRVLGDSHTEGFVSTARIEYEPVHLNSIRCR